MPPIQCHEAWLKTKVIDWTHIRGEILNLFREAQRKGSKRK